MKKRDIGVTRVIPALVARTQLGQILDRVRNNQDRFLISRNGEAAAVILSVEDYLRSIVKRPEALARLQEDARRAGSDKLTLEEIDAEIRALRRGR